MPLPDILDRFAGGPDALATILSSALSMPVAGVKTLARDVAARMKGEKLNAPKEMAESMQNMTWEPKTKTGAAIMEGLANLLDAGKVPPYVPGVGRIRVEPGTAGMLVDNAMKPGPRAGGLAAQMGAVKAPGGHFTPQSQFALAESFMRGAADDAPHIKEWADKAIPRYLNRHAGTDTDPAKGLKLGQEITYEQAMDKSLKAKPASGYAPDQLPPMTRPEELVWDYKPKPELKQFLDHVGDFLANIPPENLARLDVPTLLKQVAKADAMGGKALSKKASTREAAALELTNAHPAKDVVFESDVGKWLRFTQGQDPEYVKRGLSVDTCIGDHCVASIGHGKPNLGYPGHVPVRDLVTGKNPLQKYDGNTPLRDVMNPVKDTTSYIEQVLKGQGDIYSLRTPEGIPGATMEARRPTESGVPRSFVRDSLMNKSKYLQWQRNEKARGVPIEQDAPLLPGGGKISPPRGPLEANQIESILRDFPEYTEALTEYIKNPPHEVSQFKGMQNRAVSPRFNQMSVDMLRQQMAANKLSVGDNRATHDFHNSGILSKGRGLQSIDEALAAHPGGTPGLYGPSGAREFERLVGELPRLKGKVHLDRADHEYMHALANMLRNR